MTSDVFVHFRDRNKDNLWLCKIGSLTEAVVTPCHFYDSVEISVWLSCN